MVKVCSVKSRLLRWGCLAAICLGLTLTWSAPAWAAIVQDIPPQTSVTLRWGVRPAVSRYRLQVANDAAFSDVVIDRVVSGQEYRVNDLPPGRYYWRVASLSAKRGEFSSAGIIEVRANGALRTPSPTPPTVSNKTATNVTSRGGWSAAIGDVTGSIVAHLRGAGSFEVVAVTTDGRIVALDATRGVALWTARSPQRPPAALNPQLTVIRSRGGDNVLVLTGKLVRLIEGRTGRELSRMNLPGTAVAAIASGTNAFVVDSSLRKLFVIDPNLGRLISEAALPRRAVGNPTVITYRGARAVAVALDDGSLQVFDESGKLIITANAGSPTTTAPLMVRTARGELMLVGTRSGLTALAAEDLRPLGRVTVKDDTPRGILSAQDLDGDGLSEVVMFTERNRVVVVNGDDGRILWATDARRAESAAFADVNGDRVLDLLLAGREGFAFALSGSDGSLVWKDERVSSVNANHAPGAASREILAVPSVSAVLIIAADPNRTGLRAIEFPKR